MADETGEVRKVHASRRVPEEAQWVAAGFGVSGVPDELGRAGAPGQEPAPVEVIPTMVEEQLSRPGSPEGLPSSERIS